MNKAASLAAERGAHGFFYQMHTNGYQIAGFYMKPEDMKGKWVKHGHARGAIASHDVIGRLKDKYDPYYINYDFNFIEGA